MVNLIGDSSSGKTLVALSTLAECAHRAEFDSYDLIYRDVESACEFDIAKLFGQCLVDRLEATAGAEVLTIQDFQRDVLRVIQAGRPFIYILDSFDAMDSEQEREAAAAQAEGKKAKGSMGMEKAKVSGQILRRIVSPLKATDSLLIIISQTRDNIDPMSFQHKTRSGGNALRFYATHELWTAVAGKLKRHVNGEDFQIGVESKVKITKNKLTGKMRTVTLPLYYDLGIDDVGGCVDWLLERYHWVKRKETIEARDLALTGTREKLVREIERLGREDRLRRIVERVWLAQEEALRLDRKRRYE
jgi:recombination protein RecA